MTAKARMPKVIRVSPHNYYLTQQEELLKAVELVGQCDNENGIIRYRSDEMSDSQQRETIMHEALHAVVFNSGIKWVPEIEEDVVNRLAPRILGLLLENPQLVRWLLDE